ncbi:MAG: AAA family ATPase, partial [Dehalococcoidia bacterium]|nr:AAA family ATPase [Dehalococcoidia bacterium]
TLQESGSSAVWRLKNGNAIGLAQIPPTEPKNFIYPYLSKRKVVSYSEKINEGIVNSVTENFQNLYSKVDRLSNPRHPKNNVYMQACKDTVGFEITAAASHNGKQAVYMVGDFDTIPLSSMGEGVANILGFLVDLCIAKDKLFLVEEPENDIHPKALKSLLGLISKSSRDNGNQFIITTHSDIVVQYLGAEKDSKMFNVSIEMREGEVPTSTVVPVDDTPEARRHLLDSLGYALTDLDLWDSWLFLEESSAERIIRDYLIGWFAPGLSRKLRTFSARTRDEVEPKFEDFNNLFVYLHLQPTYKNKVWVIIDGGEKEEKIIERLRKAYKSSSWSEDHFLQFGEHDFENYYPEPFTEKVAQVLAKSNGQKKQADKKALLEEVLTWIAQDEEQAKAAFEISAKDVIEKLKLIEAAIGKG